MKNTLIILLSLYLTNVYSQTKFWELVDIDKQKTRDEIDVELMAINDKGVILVMSELIGTLGIESTLVMYRSFDNGKTWQSLTSKVEGIPQLKQQCTLTAHDSIFYLTFSGNYMRSDNNGKTWSKYKNEQSLPNYEGNHWFVDSDTRLFQYYGLVTASHRTSKGWESLYSCINPNGDSTRFIHYGNKVALTGIPNFQVLPNLMRSHCTVNRQTDYVSNQNSDDCNRSANRGMFISKVYTPDLSCKSLYTILPFNDGSGMSQGKLFLSKDKGKTFQYIKASNNNLFKTISTILPILDENQIFIYAATNTNYMNATTHYFRSKDKGYTWEQLEDPFGTIKSISPQSFIYAKDGTIFLGTSYGLYRGKEKVENKKLEPEITYGTTVITHGFIPPALVTPPYEKGEWAYEMAEAILQKANNKGCIKTYNKNTGKFDTKIDKGDGENILLFDWAKESNLNVQGYSEAAGDALFTSLILGNTNNDFSLNNIHFIGHSRGTVVNTETIERLLALKKESAYSSKISINQVTNLDPHDWGGLNSTLAKDFDNHPNLVIDCPHIGNPNNGVISWENSGFNDTYYQVGNSTLGSFVVLDGRPVKGTYNVNWSVEAPGHSEIHKYYLKSILNTSFSNGYKHSRIANSLNIIKPEPSECGKEREVIKYDYFEPMIFNNSSRIRGIMNGSFDRGYAGWEEHGGNKPSFKNILDMKSSIDCDECANLTISDSLVHNRFYIPVNSKSIKFQYKAAKFKNGKIRIEIVDILNKNNLKDIVIDLKDANEYKEESIDILNLQDKVVILKFKFITNLADTKYYPQLLIDNVKLSTEGITSQRKLLLNNQNVNKEMPKDENSNIQITSNAKVIGKLNGNFNTNEGWNTTGGETIFEKGKVSLKPDKNSTPVKLFSNAFNISANARQLKLKIAKNLVGKGDIKVSLRNIAANTTDDIYSSKINNVGSKIDNILTNANKVLDGNLNLKKIEPTFEAITIDISKYAGIAVSLEIYFTNTGSSKQPIIIDGITIN